MPLPQKPAASAGAAVAQKPTGSIFSGMKGTKPLLNSEYVRPGSYIARFDCHKEGANRLGEPFAAIEMTVVHVEDDAGGAGHRLGAAITHLIKKTGKVGDYFKAEVVTHIGSLAEMNPAEVDDEMCALVFGETQPFAGTLCRVRGRNVTTKADKDFTRISYEPIKASQALGILTPDEVARFFPDGLLERMAEAEK